MPSEAAFRQGPLEASQGQQHLLGAAPGRGLHQVGEYKQRITSCYLKKSQCNYITKNNNGKERE